MVASKIAAWLTSQAGRAVTLVQQSASELSNFLPKVGNTVLLLTVSEGCFLELLLIPSVASTVFSLSLGGLLCADQQLLMQCRVL